MPEKNPTTYSWLTYAWVLLLSTCGGIVNFLRKRKSGAARPFFSMPMCDAATGHRQKALPALPRQRSG